MNDWEVGFRLGHGMQLPCYLDGGGGHAERQPQEGVYQSSVALIQTCASATKDPMM